MTTRTTDANLIRETAEKVAEVGTRTLSDVELLTLVLRSKAPAETMARTINLRRLHNCSLADLRAVPGMTEARAQSILAVVELGRRLWPDDPALPLVRGPEQIHELMRPYLDEKREYFVGFYLDSRHQVIRQDVISIGTLNASIVHPREVFSLAVRLSAASIVLAHNHPSGDPTPSEEDHAITRRLHEAGRLLGVELVDHVVVARSGYVSFREKRYLKG